MAHKNYVGGSPKIKHQVPGVVVGFGGVAMMSTLETRCDEWQFSASSVASIGATAHTYAQKIFGDQTQGEVDIAPTGQ